MAFTPISFSVFNLVFQTSLGTADPKTPASWCKQTPFIFIHFPLRAKPLFGSNVKFLKPVCVTVLSISFPSFKTVVLSSYKFGLSKSHNCGFLTFNFVEIFPFCFAARSTFEDDFATDFPSFENNSFTTVKADFDEDPFSTSTSIFKIPAPFLTSG